MQAQDRSRKETAEIVGVAPETISVWKRHPQWQLEVDRWRAFAEAPVDRQQLRLKLESAEATIEALEQLRLIMGPLFVAAPGSLVTKCPSKYAPKHGS